MIRPTQAIVNLNALKHNYQLAQSIAPNSKNMAIIKANAYGHGMIQVAKTLETLAPAFGVATIDEALELREAGIRKPILLLQGALEQSEIKLASKHDLWLMLSNKEQAAMLIASNINSPLGVWLKIDTGMHRLGIQTEEFNKIYNDLNTHKNVQENIVLSTHFARADELDCQFTNQQIELFSKTIADIKAPIISMANSPGLLGWEKAKANWNRIGYMLYGNSPFSSSHPIADQLQPVMTFKSTIISINDVAKNMSIGYGHIWQADRASKIATVTVGYGDGYPRNAASGTPVFINGNRASLIGRVSMDMITIDVTDIKNVGIGDEVELWGSNITANEVAHHSATSGYEILTRRTNRAPNIYKE